jgi:large subunit ribosomal protein L5
MSFKEKYKSEIVPTLFKEQGYKSIMQVPKLEKIVINIGLGEAVLNAKVVDEAFEELKTVAGQLPVVTKAKKSISNFKLRQGMPIGLKVTLRGEKMFYFLEKLIRIVLPRVRDFRGISASSFDGRGNYALGVKELTIFPEINIDKVTKTRGMDIVIVTTAKTDKECKVLLEKFGMPFRR